MAKQGRTAKKLDFDPIDEAARQWGVERNEEGGRGVTVSMLGEIAIRRGDGDPVMRLGLTVSKKVGGAVVRNRMKRRFRELARLILPEAGLAGADHVLIGRQGGIERPYDQLAADLERALAKLRK